MARAHNAKQIQWLMGTKAQSIKINVCINGQEGAEGAKGSKGYQGVECVCSGSQDNGIWRPGGSHLIPPRPA